MGLHRPQRMDPSPSTVTAEAKEASTIIRGYGHWGAMADGTVAMQSEWGATPDRGMSSVAPSLPLVDWRNIREQQLMVHNVCKLYRERLVGSVLRGTDRLAPTSDNEIFHLGLFVRAKRVPLCCTDSRTGTLVVLWWGLRRRCDWGVNE